MQGGIHAPGKLCPRPYFYCPHCRLGFHPLDEIVQLADELHQHDIQKRISKLAANVPYEEAAKMFEELTGMKVGNHFAHNTLNAVAQSVTVDNAIADAEDISRRIATATGPQGELPVLVVACDGALAPTRPKASRSAKRGKGSWQEAKGLRIYLLDPSERIHHVACWHQIGSHEDLSKALEIAAQRIDKTKVRVVLLGDGAGWVWNAMLKHFPQGAQILDFYHVFEQIHWVAGLKFKDDAEWAYEWAEATMVRLCEGHYKRVIAGLSRMSAGDELVEQEIGKLIVYLNNHGPKMNYGEALAGGYPIGSGGLESANKCICHTRLKRSGAWWVHEMANNVLRIRCSIYNDTFDKAFDLYMRSRFGEAGSKKTLNE
ncbi:MAG: ISKra4 family transposase [Syntrophobacteraceae bacterium]